MKTTNIGRKKRLMRMLIVAFIICNLLIVRVGFIQFVQGSELKAKAYAQQTLNRNINPKRGTIWDATGKVALAVSASVETVSVNPTNIAKADKERVARALADIFDLEYEKVLKKVSKNSSIETIVKKVEKEQTDKLRVWLKENNVTTGINIDEDSKRYYPYSTLAANVIGFTGSDNQGLDGVESRYDEILKGTKGRILKLTDATGSNMDKEGEDYIAAINGDDLVLSIDMTVQSIAEKYLSEACIDNVCTDGGNVIIMEPKTGDVLALASYPSYDLNFPYTINVPELETSWTNLESGEKSKALQQMWRNKAISDTYEPGSTFKLVTASAAIEEKIVTDIDKVSFGCTGSINIVGTRIKCWRYYRPHGSESLRLALMNSCNPVFIGLGQQIGVEKYYDYLEKFGLLEKTGIDLPGEANSIFLKEEKVGPVELATISFGQRFEVTPMQMIKMVGTIANFGKSVAPRIVKGTIDSETGERTDFEVKDGQQAISEETAKKVLNMMNSVVSEGTGKNAQVVGYSIGGKTGTSEDGVNTGKYVTSFIGVANTENPELVILIVLYNPTGEGGHQGGGVAAPIASQILGEVLPYLEVSKSQEDTNTMQVEMPELTGMTVKEGIQILKELGLEYEIDTDNVEVIITDQLPKKGIQINQGTKVILYSN